MREGAKRGQKYPETEAEMGRRKMTKKKVFGEQMRKEDEGKNEGKKERRRKMLRYVCEHILYNSFIFCVYV